MVLLKNDYSLDLDLRKDEVHIFRNFGSKWRGGLWGGP